MSKDNPLNQSGKIPFNAYDIFGYLIPGSTFVIICVIFDVWLMRGLNGQKYEKISVPFYTAFSSVLNETLMNNITLSIIYLLFGAIFTYVLGHIIASVSAFAIDRLLTGKGYNYPVVTLTSTDEQLKPSRAQNRVRAGFTLFNATCILFTALLVANGMLNRFDSKKIVSEIIIIIMVSLLIWIFFYMTGREKDEEEEVKMNKFTDYFSSKYNYWAKRIGFFMGTHKRLSDDIITKYKIFVRKELDRNEELLDSDTYWLSYMYVVSKSKVLHNHLLNWLNLYSYARNLSTSLYLSTVYIFIIISINKYNGIELDYISYLILVIIYTSSFVMLMRYFYLYVSYYSKFLIRACVYLHSHDKK